MRKMKNEEIIEAWKIAIPYINQLVPVDMSIALYVDGICQAVTPGVDLNLGVEVGTDMRDDPALISAAQKKRVLHNVLPREMFGIAVEGELVPVFNSENDVVGVLATAYGMEKQFQVEKSSEDLSESLAIINDTIGKLANAAENLMSSVENVQAISEGLSAEVVDVAKTVEMIQNCSKTSTILSLNASIEAARAGTAGKAFAVVANQMRDFSKESALSANQITMNLEQMRAAIENLHNQVNSMLKEYEDQVSSIADITERMKSVAENADELSVLARNQ